MAARNLALPEPRPIVEPDDVPGPFYVSQIRDGRTLLLSGPYPTHREAVAMVKRATALSCDLDAWSAFDSFGTVRMAATFDRQGALQRLGYDLELNDGEGS